MENEILRNVCHIQDFTRGQNKVGRDHGFLIEVIFWTKSIQMKILLEERTNERAYISSGQMKDILQIYICLKAIPVEEEETKLWVQKRNDVFWAGGLGGRWVQ